MQRQLDGLSTGFETTAANVADTWNRALGAHRQSNEALAEHWRTSLDRLTDTFDHRSAGLLEGVAARLDTTASRMSQAWTEALSQQDQANAQLTGHHQRALEAATATFEQHAATLQRTLHQSHEDLQAGLASRDEQRLAAWTDTLGSMATTLSQQWDQAGARTASHQQAICETLARTAHDISARTQAHASDTIAELSRLAQAASEAPKAAAEVVAELRQKLSDSMVRDTEMLEERGRLLATVQTLLDAVNHASTEQRTAVDGLISTSADLLDRVGTRFADQVQAEGERLGTAAAQVTGSAVEMASLGDAFGAAVQLFGESNDKLVAHLQRLESTLDKSLSRSDEQLAYYVAQAREVIDLSVMSQQQILEDMQRLAGQRTPLGAEAA